MSTTAGKIECPTGFVQFTTPGGSPCWFRASEIASVSECALENAATCISLRGDGSDEEAIWTLTESPAVVLAAIARAS